MLGCAGPRRGHELPSRRLSPDGDGNTVNVGKGCPCPMKGPASLRVEQKGQPWRSHRSTDEAGETSGGKAVAHGTVDE